VESVRWVETGKVLIVVLIFFSATCGRFVASTNRCTKIQYRSHIMKQWKQVTCSGQHT